MARTSLSMLWEQSDPAEVLRDRFGFEGPEAATSWLAETLAATWALDLGYCERIVISDANALAWIGSPQGEFVVKWSRVRDRFVRSAEVMSRLCDQGLPIAGPVATIEGGRSALVESDAGALAVIVLPKLAGRPLDAADPAQVEAAGRCLARLHRALSDASRNDAIETPDLDLHRRLGTDQAGRAPEAAERLVRRLAGLKPLEAAPQLVHGDYRAANILTEDADITAVVDFDSLRWDYRVDELARSCTYLTTLYHDWAPTPPEVRKRFLDAYRSIEPLGSAEENWLEVLLLWYGINAVPRGPDPAGWGAALSRLGPGLDG